MLFSNFTGTVVWFQIICLYIFYGVQCIPDTITDLEYNKIGFGSCSKQYKDQSFWLNVEKENIDAWFWLGDVVYPNCSSDECIKSAYETMNNNAYYTNFKKKVKLIDGTWDDHDFGVNDGGGDFLGKNVSRMEFLKLIGLSEKSSRYSREGIYSSHVLRLSSSRNLIKLIILDTRYFRDRPYFLHAFGQYDFFLSNIVSILMRILTQLFRLGENIPNDFLGEEQWKWLAQEFSEKQINGDPVVMTVLMSSIQVLTTMPFFESWKLMPNSQARLINLIKESQPNNLIVVSGDIHLAHIFGDSNCVLEITTSGLTHTFEEYVFFLPRFMQKFLEILISILIREQIVIEHNDHNFIPANLIFQKNFTTFEFVENSDKTGMLLKITIKNMNDQILIYIEKNLKYNKSPDYSCLLQEQYKKK